MNRVISVAAYLVAATMLFPASAEAKRRFGGGSRAVAPAAAEAKTNRSLVVVPAGGIGASRARASETGAPARVPFPPATAQQGQPAPTLASATVSDSKPVWCRSEVVVGGFCMMN